MSPGTPYDVLVIGAGVAGLAAARELSGVGLRIAVLDARDRLGGRIHTVRDPAFNLPVELGAEFIHGRAPNSLAAARAGGLAVCELSDEHWLFHDGRLKPAEDMWSKMEPIMARLTPDVPADQTFADFLNTCCSGDDLREARALATAFVEGFDAAPINRVSARALAEEQRSSEAIDGDRQFRLLGGYNGLIRWLAAGLSPSRASLHLNTIVREIHWEPGRVTVQAHSASGQALSPFQAARALVTLPINILKLSDESPGAVRFIPDLAGEKRSAMDLIEAGPVVKAVLRFREPFWESHQPPGLDDREPLFDMSFVHWREGHFPTWWTALPVRADTLTGWAGGPAAARLSGQDPHATLALALDDLSRVLGFDRSRLESLVVAARICDWQRDPFSRGAYSYLRPRGSDAPRALAAPLANTLFFAGEATATGGISGTVEGALSSGYRAATEILGR